MRRCGAGEGASRGRLRGVSLHHRGWLGLATLSVLALSACAVVPPPQTRPFGPSPSAAPVQIASTDPSVSVADTADTAEAAAPKASGPEATDIEDLTELGPESGGPAAGYFPTEYGAIDASKYGQSWFASASGYTFCALTAVAASCDFPRDMDRTTVPKPSTACTGDSAGTDVTGVTVGASGAAHYACNSAPVSTPTLDQDATIAWWTQTEIPPAVSPYDGSPLVVLPYGQKLKSGNFVCDSSDTALSCGNLATGQGFSVEIGGVHLLTR